MDIRNEFRNLWSWFLWGAESGVSDLPIKALVPLAKLVFYQWTYTSIQLGWRRLCGLSGYKVQRIQSCKLGLMVTPSRSIRRLHEVQALGIMRSTSALSLLTIVTSIGAVRACDGVTGVQLTFYGYPDSTLNCAWDFSCQTNANLQDR